MLKEIIELSNHTNFWEKVVYGFVAINVIGSFIFTAVVVIGGLFDLKRLFASLSKEPDEIHKTSKINTTP